MKTRKQVEVAMPVAMEQKPEVTFRSSADSKVIDDVLHAAKHGRTMVVEVTGKVTGFRADKFDKTVTLEIKSLDCEPTMGQQIEEQKERRKGY